VNRRFFRKYYLNLLKFIKNRERLLIYKSFSGILFTILLVGTLLFAFTINQVKTTPITVVVPDDFSTIQEAINHATEGDTIYVRAGIYRENVVVNKTVILLGDNQDSIILGEADGIAMEISSNNVTVKGFTIQGVNRIIDYRGFLVNATFTKISQNRIINASYGIIICGNYNIITWNILTSTFRAILCSGYYNKISNNFMEGNIHGVCPQIGENNTVSGNKFIRNDVAIEFLLKNRYISIVDNIFLNNSVGIDFIFFGDNRDNFIFHNYFINNTEQVVIEAPTENIWDNGYPSGGNYWSDYGGMDVYSGPFQNETGSDGLGDTPYVIDEYNVDRYPLMKPWTTIVQDVAVVDVFSSVIEAYAGWFVNITVIVRNEGARAETFNVAVYYDNSYIETQIVVDLEPGENLTLAFMWNTTGVAPGNYTIKAEASILPGEKEMQDNTMTSPTKIKIKMLGDVNGDKKIDIQDISMAALAFGTNPNHSRWKPEADLNQDDKIDIYDLAIVAQNYGKTYS